MIETTHDRDTAKAARWRRWQLVAVVHVTGDTVWGKLFRTRRKANEWLRDMESKRRATGNDKFHFEVRKR